MHRPRVRFAVIGLALALLAPLCRSAAPAPLDRLELLLKQSHEIEPNEPLRAIALAREALALAQTLPGPGPELRARARLGDALRLASNYREARTVIDAGLALPRTAATRLERAGVLYISGQIHWNLSDYAAAERCYLDVRREAEALHERRLLISTLNSLGIVARRQKNLAESIGLHRAALELVVSGEDADLQLQLQNNLANTLVEQGDFTAARALYTANLAAHTRSGNRRSIANALINLGTLESAAGRLPEALDYNLRALALREELGVPRHIAAAHISVGSVLAKLGRGSEALAHLRAADPIAEKLSSHELSGNLYAAYCVAFCAEGDFRAALEAQQKAEKENALVSGEQTARTIAELRERFDAEKREHQLSELHAEQARKDAALALQEAQLRRAQLERYGLAGMLLLGGITVTAVIGRQRARTRAERLILEETRHARDAAQAAHVLKSRLLDLASHDLKAPLVGVMMTAETIAEDALGQPEIARRALAVKEEANRMFALVRNLLDASALEQGHAPLTRAPVELGALAREVISEFSPRAADKRQRIELAVEAEGSRIEGDAVRLRQVIANLVDNACKFSPPGATVRVAVRGSAPNFRLEVRDEGPGLTPEDRRNLFQRFRRLSATPTGGEASHGLGLALVHDIVAQHGGRIRGESTPGAGATFIVEF
jgi:signal transduction histidine kinase